jgi:hypothetical protein
MTVQYSIQKMVSDGTLSTIALGIQYLQRNDIYMRIAGEETPQSGAPSGYTWSFVDNTTLKILPVVPSGVAVVVFRRTDIDEMYNIYSQNAQFDEATIDENNQQLLYIAQEYLEQGIPGAGVDTIEFLRDDGTYSYYRLKRTDGSYSDEFAVPSAGNAAKVLSREAIRRSYAEAGYNLVTGSFQAGFTLVNANDVALDEAIGKAFSGTAGTYPASTPTSGFVDQSSSLRGANTFSDIRNYVGSSKELRCIGRQTVFDGGHGDFARDDSDTSSLDNDGTIIVDAIGRRWKRIIDAGYVNVMWFGADIYGINNSREAINSAIKFTSETGGGKVYFPHGDYLVASNGGQELNDKYVVMLAGVTLSGCSYGASRIVRGSPETIITTESPDVSAGFSFHKNIVIENMFFDGNYSEFFFPANLVKIDSCTDLFIKNCEFINVPGLHALDLNRCKHVRISNSRFYGTSKALAIQFGGTGYKPEAIQIAWGDNQDSPDYCEDVKVFDCVFDKNSTLAGSDYFISAFGNHSSLNSGGAVMRDIEFYGNIVTGCSQAAVKALQCVGYSVHDNFFYNCQNVFGLYTNYHPEFGKVDMNDISFKDNFIGGFSGSVVYSVQLAYSSPSEIQKINNLEITGNKIKGQVPSSTSSVIDCVIVDGYKVSDNTVLGNCHRFLQHEYCSSSIVSNNIIESTKLNSINIIEQRNTNLNGQGFSTNISIENNKVLTTGQRGIHLNCPATNVEIKGNVIRNANTETGGSREAIKVDSYPTNVSVTNNVTSYDNGIPYTYGVLVSTVNDCYVSGNKTQPGSLGATGSAASGTTSTIFLDCERVTENPEGVHIGSVGSSVVNINGTAGAVRYLKESGIGRNGWVAK